MLFNYRTMERERIYGLTLILSMVVLIFSVIGLRLLNVGIKNIEFKGHGTYAVVTDKGTVDVSAADIIRIEQSQMKAAFSGNLVEQDKIFTREGVIYLLASAPYAQQGKELMNSIHYGGEHTWMPAGMSPVKNWQVAILYDFAIGTPKNWVPLINFLLWLQELSLFVGAIALVVLIIPVQHQLALYRKLTGPIRNYVKLAQAKFQ